MADYGEMRALMEDRPAWDRKVKGVTAATKALIANPPQKPGSRSSREGWALAGREKKQRLLLLV